MNVFKDFQITVAFRGLHNLSLPVGSKSNSSVKLCICGFHFMGTCITLFFYSTTLWVKEERVWLTGIEELFIRKTELMNYIPIP